MTKLRIWTLLCLWGSLGDLLSFGDDCIGCVASLHPCSALMNCFPQMLPCAFFYNAPAVVWYLHLQLQITIAPSILKLRNKLNSVCWKKSGWALTATCSMPFIHWPASAANHRHCPMPLPWLSSTRIKIVKSDLQVQLCSSWTGIDWSNGVLGKNMHSSEKIAISKW